jgi:hypothetical protein
MLPVLQLRPQVYAIRAHDGAAVLGEALPLPEHSAATTALVGLRYPGSPIAALHFNLAEAIRPANRTLERNEQICHTVRIYRPRLRLFKSCD